MSMSPIFTPVALWDWTISNGSATIAQTEAAYEALSNKGLTVNFAASVWNDIVDKIYAARQSAGLTWRSDYATRANTYVTSNSSLTAVKFNALIENVAYPKYSWQTVSSAKGYVGREYFRGKATVGITTADYIYGTYFIELLQVLNIILQVYSGEIDRAEIQTINNALASFTSDLIARQALPVSAAAVLSKTVSAPLNKIPSFRLNISAQQHISTMAEMSQVLGGLAPASWYANLYITLAIHKAQSKHFSSSLNALLSAISTANILPPFGCTAGAALQNVNDVICESFEAYPLTLSMTETLNADADFSFLTSLPFNVLHKEKLTFDNILRYSFPFALSVNGANTLTITPILLAQRLLEVNILYQALSVVNATMTSGVLCNFDSFAFDHTLTTNGIIGTAVATSQQIDISYEHTVICLMQRNASSVLGHSSQDFVVSLLANFSVASVTSQNAIANISHALHNVASISNLGNVKLIQALSSNNLSIPDSLLEYTNDITPFAATVHGSIEPFGTLQFSSILGMPFIHSLQQVHVDENIDILPPASFKVIEVHTLYPIALLELLVKEWLDPVQDESKLYIRQVYRSEKDDSWLNLEQVSIAKQIQVEATSSASGTLSITNVYLSAESNHTLSNSCTLELEESGPSWLVPVAKDGNLYVRQAKDINETNKNLEVL